MRVRWEMAMALGYDVSSRKDNLKTINKQIVEKVSIC